MAAPIRLASRSVLRVAGLDSVRFLQGLVTVNVHRFCSGRDEPPAPALYGAFLNRRGRVEHAAFLVPGKTCDSKGSPEEIFLDVDSKSAHALRAHLIRHRLRAKVQMDDISDDVGVIVRKHTASFNFPNASFYNDPRLDQLHQRAIVSNSNSESLDTDETLVTAERVLLGVPDGPDYADAPLPLHLALHLLRSVDFDKGCYLGQELTARTHFTGVLRKRITPIAVGVNTDTLNNALSHDIDPAHALQKTVLQLGTENDLRVGERVFLAPGGKAAGIVTSVAGNCGLAVMKLQYLFGDPPSAVVGAQLITEDGRPALPWKPHWWDDEVPVRAQPS